MLGSTPRALTRAVRWAAGCVVRWSYRRATALRLADGRRAPVNVLRCATRGRPISSNMSIRMVVPPGAPGSRGPRAGAASARPRGQTAGSDACPSGIDALEAAHHPFAETLDAAAATSARLLEGDHRSVRET